MNSVGRTVVGVLGLWHGLAALQNAFDILAEAAGVRFLRPMASKNLAYIVEVLEPLHAPKGVPAMLLGGASLIEAAAAVSFLGAVVEDKDADAGFALSLALFGAFFLIDDALDDYDLGAKHRGIFTFVAAAYAATKAASR
jgi:hypothetical protein